MSSVYDGDVSRLAPKSRNTRSHSLKPQSQPVIFKRSKRTMSLPSKPVLLPLINVQRYYDNWENEGDENDEGERKKEEMGKLCFDCFCLRFFPISHRNHTYSIPDLTTNTDLSFRGPVFSSLASSQTITFT